MTCHLTRGILIYQLLMLVCDGRVTVGINLSTSIHINLYMYVIYTCIDTLTYI